jgi:hypothetical protein
LREKRPGAGEVGITVRGTSCPIAYDITTHSQHYLNCHKRFRLWINRGKKDLNGVGILKD